MHFNKNKTLRFKPLKKLDLNEIPEPLTWHVLVQPYVPEEKTTGGFHISETDNDDYKKMHCVGKILKMGPLCFQAEAFKNSQPFQTGDVIFFGRHNGLWMNWNGEDLVLLADDRMLMRVREEQLVNLDGFSKHSEEYEE